MRHASDIIVAFNKFFNFLKGPLQGKHLQQIRLVRFQIYFHVFRKWEEHYGLYMQWLAEQYTVFTKRYLRTTSWWDVWFPMLDYDNSLRESVVWGYNLRDDSVFPSHVFWCLFSVLTLMTVCSFRLASWIFFYCNTHDLICSVSDVLVLWDRIWLNR